MKDSALYVHIPFCDHKCIYCDFYSITTKDSVEGFSSAVLKEIRSYRELYSKERIFSSLFLGGGTPSLMSSEYIYKIIDELRNSFCLTDDAEITLETNPGTVNYKKLKDFRNLGFNRISIGIQTFHDDELKFLTRIHSSAQAEETVFLAREAGFENINIDLIFNLPDQTKERWLANLQKAVSLPVKHISAYSLIIERGTILQKMINDGKVSIRDADYDAEIYELTIDFLKKYSFLQYEVSNFARQGYECRHNNAYWRYRDYLSFGPSAHSFVDGKRWWNFRSLKRYITEIDRTGSAVAGSECLTEEQMLNEYIMLAFRSSGLFLDEFTKRFGTQWLNKKNDFFRSLRNRGLIYIDEKSIKLTSKGYALCDEILDRVLNT